MNTHIVSLLLTVLPTLAQSPATPPPNPASGLQVIRFGWEKQRDSSLSLERGLPRADDVMVQRRRQPPTIIHTGPTTKVGNYKYSMEVQNMSDKKIASIEWHYVFIDARSNQEALRIKLSNKVKVKAGGSAKVRVYTDAAPYQVVGVKGANDKPSERVEIRRITYDDGTTWEG